MVPVEEMLEPSSEAVFSPPHGIATPSDATPVEDEDFTADVDLIDDVNVAENKTEEPEQTEKTDKTEVAEPAKATPSDAEPA